MHANQHGWYFVKSPLAFLPPYEPPLRWTSATPLRLGGPRTHRRFPSASKDPPSRTATSRALLHLHGG